MIGKCVLIVEDNERNRRLVRDVLSFHGYQVCLAANGEEGLQLARDRLPQLILLDIQLPDMDGTTALLRLRSEPATAAIPVIAVTAYAMSGDRERLLAAGFDGYMAKPFDIVALAATVAGYCG